MTRAFPKIENRQLWLTYPVTRNIMESRQDSACVWEREYMNNGENKLRKGTRGENSEDQTLDCS